MKVLQAWSDPGVVHLNESANGQMGVQGLRRKRRDIPGIVAAAIAGFLGLLATGSTLAQTFTDSFEAAPTLTMPSGVYGGLLLWATAEPGEPDHGGSAAAHSSWCRVHNPVETLLTMSGGWPGGAIRVVVYTGTALTNLTPVAGAALTSSGPPLDVRLAASTLYHVVVDGPPLGGSFTLDVRARSFFLTQPGRGQSALATAPLTLEATNTTIAKALASVAFHETAPQARLIGIRTNAPWSLTTTNMGGDTTFTATATFQDNSTATSQPVTVRVLQPNDLFADAFTIPAESTTFEVAASAAGATAEAGEPAHAGIAFPAQSIWWRWTPLYTGPVRIAQPNPEAVCWLAVYSGQSLANLRSEANLTIPLMHSTTFEARAGTTYSIACDSGLYRPTALEWTLQQWTLGLVLPPGVRQLTAGRAATLLITNNTPSRPLREARLLEGTHVLAVASAPFTSFSWTPERPAWRDLSVQGVDEAGQERLSPTTAFRVAPGNDLWEDAAVLPAEGLVMTFGGTNGLATAEPGEPRHTGESAARSLWWDWTPAGDGTVTLLVTNRNVGSLRVAVYHGETLSNLLPAASLRIEEGSPAQPLLFAVRAGVRYWIAVDSANTGPEASFEAKLERHTLLVVDVFPGAKIALQEPASFTVVNQDPTFEPKAVNLLLDGVGLGAVDQPPYQWSWTANEGGWHRLQAHATNLAGETRWGPVIDFLVGPGNDDWARAKPLPGGGVPWTIRAAAAFSSWEPGEPDAHPESGGGSVWFRWEPPRSRDYSLRFLGPAGARLDGYTGTSLTNLAPVFNTIEGETTFTAFFDVAAPHYFRVSLPGSATQSTPFQLELLAPPSNDDLANSTDLAGSSGVIAITNLSSSLEPGEEFIGILGSLWWRWTAPESGMLSVWAEDSECFVMAAVLTGTSFENLTLKAGPARLLAHSPWAANPLVQRVQKGRTYLIELGSDPQAGPRTGLLRAVYAFEVIPDLPPNDDFCDRIRLSGASIAASETCASASVEMGEPWDTRKQTLWWEWVAAQDGAARIWAEGEGFPPIVMVYTGSTIGTLQEAYPRFDRLNLGGISGPFSLPVKAGDIYQISVGMPDWIPIGAQATLRIENETLTSPVANDAFAAAELLPETTYRAATSFSQATYEPGEPDHDGAMQVIATYSGSLWWRLEPTRASRFVVRATGGGTRPWVAIYREPALPTNQPIAAGFGIASWEVAIGETYQVAVVGPNLFTNACTIETECLPLVAPNDLFANSILLVGTNIDFGGVLYGCTHEPAEPSHSPYGEANDGRTVWWTWVAPFSGRGTIAFDTMYLGAAIYTGAAVDHLLRVLVTGQSFYAAKDMVYHIGVEGFLGAPDSVALQLSLIPLPELPRNDRFADAIELQGRQSGTTESNLGATREAGEPLHRAGGPNKSLWWRWTAPHHADAYVRNLTGTLGDVTLAVYAGTNLDTLFLIARGADNVQFYAKGGITYSIAAETPADRDGEVGVSVLLRSPDGNAIPVAGNLVLNPSFEEVEQGWPTARWETAGGIGGVVNQGQRTDAADGGNYLQIGAGSIAQTIPTVAGGLYRIKLAVGGTDYYGPARVLVRFGAAAVAEYQFEADAGQRYWHWPEFILPSSSELTRLEIENVGVVVSIDQVSVVAANQPPRFAKPPESRSAFSGASVNFRVGVEGDDPISLQWLFNGQPLLGEQGWALVLENVGTNHSGTYQCRATNPFGTALSAAANLVVQAATSPIIVLQPQDAAPAVGDYVSLVVVALGTPPLRLQWFKDGLPLESETNRTLILPQFNGSQAGRYYVVVSNLAESVTSLAATVTESPAGPGGGSLHLRNRSLEPAGFAAAPIYDLDGITPLQGDAFQAQLYVGASSNTLHATGQPRPFLTGITQGYITSEVVILSGFPASTSVLAQIRVWETADGLSYEEARAIGGETGESAVLHVTTGPSNPPHPNLGLLRGLTSFNLHAGMPEFQGGILSPVSRDPGGTLTWSLLGQAGARYLVERKMDGANWLPLLTLENSSGQVTFTDQPQAAVTAVFYRAQLLP